MTYRSNLKRSPGWKRIYYGFYEINKHGTVRRVKPGTATFPGRVLSPYHITGSPYGWVKLYANGNGGKQFRVSHLVARHF